MGQMSVNMKPIRAEVMTTRIIKTKYFMYLKRGSILCWPNFRITGYFFNFLAILPVPRCKRPMGHAHPQIALPVSAPKNPRIRIG